MISATIINHCGKKKTTITAITGSVDLKMAVSRIQIASNKKSALMKQSMREIAVLLSEGKEEKAKIRAEALIRDDNLIEAYEILQLQCELLYERIKLIEYSKHCPPDLIPVVSTLLWASRRVDIPELIEIRKQFKGKYGKTFEENAMENRGSVLNERVVMKLSVDPPAAYLVQTYLEKIAEQFEVDWKPTSPLSVEQMVIPVAPPVGYSVGIAQGTGLGPTATYLPTSQASAHMEHHTMSAQTGYASGMGTPTNDHNNSRVPSKFSDDLPPPIVTATHVTPVPPHSVISNVSEGIGGSNGGNGGTPGPSPNMDDFGEFDIFVPASSKNTPNNSAVQDDIPPSAPSPHGDSTVAPASTTNNNTMSASYSDLAARFEQLKQKK